MKKLLVLLVLLLSGSFLAVKYESQIADFIYSSPCDIPIPYKIGEIDQGFHVTYDQFLTDIKEATDIWDKAYGKPVFVLSSQAVLTVNY
ncbi:MAG: hypothetical protein KGL95_10950, partial [Patescibacteria group bacterium]|nr:hypothetical protein [Patescibacteria group bacterium]